MSSGLSGGQKIGPSDYRDVGLPGRLNTKGDFIWYLSTYNTN